MTTIILVTSADGNARPVAAQHPQRLGCAEGDQIRHGQREQSWDRLRRAETHAASNLHSQVRYPLVLFVPVITRVC